MTATTAIPTRKPPHLHRYVRLALPILLALGIGMATSSVVFDDDPARMADTTDVRPASATASAEPTMSPDAAERWATSETDAYQRKAAAEAAERQSASRSGADGDNDAIAACSATASSPDTIERCAARR